MIITKRYMVHCFIVIQQCSLVFISCAMHQNIKSKVCSRIDFLETIISELNGQKKALNIDSLVCSDLEMRDRVVSLFLSIKENKPKQLSRIIDLVVDHVADVYADLYQLEYSKATKLKETAIAFFESCQKKLVLNMAMSLFLKPSGEKLERKCWEKTRRKTIYNMSFKYI